MLGTPFMPWQRHVVDVICEIDPRTGLFFYRSWRIVVPRQSGKTTLVLAKAVHRARAWQRQRIAYAAQTRNDSRKKWEDDHLAALDASAYGKRRPRLYKPRKTNGNEAILWDNGSMHGILATTKKSGHGPTLDEAFIDEAFAQIDWRLEQAVRPSMITKENAQLGVLSTAGESPEASPYLWSKVESGREMLLDLDPSVRVAHFEWSAPDDMDRADPATWLATMPALGITVSLDTIQAEFDDLPAEEFDRAYLNRWGTSAGKPVISDEIWNPLGTSEGMLDPATLAIDTTPDGGWTTITAVGDADGDPTKAAGSVVDHRPGTAWVVDRLVELHDRWGVKGIVLDPRGPAGALLTDLESRDLPLILVTTTQYVRACAELLDAVQNGRLLHENDPILNAAVAGASRRKIDDAWKWTRTGSSADISPIVSLTLALYGHQRPLDDIDDEDWALVV